MRHFHGLPITPERIVAEVLRGRNACVSFANPEQLGIALSVCSGVMLDNGAFSRWTAGEPTDWPGYYRWVESLARHPRVAFAIIPDVIDGTEQDNDRLIEEWPLGLLGVPVWHLHEPIARFARLCRAWPRVALGSSGEFSDPGSPRWWDRMSEALDAVCVDCQPIALLHGLRMLDPEIFTRIPFASCDSTSVGRNIGIDSRWTGSYAPPTKAARAEVLAARIEVHQSADRWAGRPVQESFFGRTA